MSIRIRTVGDLREALADAHPLTQVYVDDGHTIGDVDATPGLVTLILDRPAGDDQ